jgi:hypothetical protein
MEINLVPVFGVFGAFLFVLAFLLITMRLARKR